MYLSIFKRGIKLFGVAILIFLSLGLESAPLKVKVIVANATVKVKPEIGGETLLRVSLDAILEAEEKQGEWYKVFIEKDGAQVPGFIHEMLVEVVGEEGIIEQEAPPGVKKPQEVIVSEIEAVIEDNRQLIRQEKGFDKTIEALRPLIAKVFRVSNFKKQKELATEIYLLRGLAFAGQNEEYSAMLEFKNMFEVDYTLAKEIVHNLYNPNVNILIQQAEKAFQGIKIEYSLEILTQPENAEIKINGEIKGISPQIFETVIPSLVIEIDKEGYKPVREEIFLTLPSLRKEYSLERTGRNIEVKSIPAGAKVYLDDIDTQKVTDCVLPFVSFGVHRIKVIKENYTEWEGGVEIEKGDESLSVHAVITGRNYGFHRKWGGPDQKVLIEPAGVAVDNNDNIYIVDMSDAKVKKFDVDGKLKTSWEREGKDFKKLKEPAGIAVDNQGFIFVTDEKNHCVMKFDKVGRFIKKWGKEGNEPEEFKNPFGIAVNNNNDIYIVDSGNHRLKIYTPMNVLKKVWGKQGASDGSFIFPKAVAVNRNNEVYVLDRFRVQKFSPDGEFIASWGKSGTRNGEFKSPIGICVDTNGFVYVADSGNHRIQKFDENGVYITQWGGLGKGDSLMNFPSGLVVNSKGYVIAVERDNNRLQVFSVPSQF